jgi:pimeloyl-[acyl-carrier protein] methyl ester esterase
MTRALRVDAVGEGPPLVLLHGWAMHSGFWGSLVPRLARRHRVHAVDLPGHGGSPAPSEFTLDGVVAALDATFGSAGPPLTLMGWSLGGLVAMRWALVQPDRIDRLALVSTSPRFVAGDDWPHAMSPETLDRFGDELRVAWKLTVQRFLALQLQGTPHSRPLLADMRERLLARNAPSTSTLIEALEVLKDCDFRDDIARIEQPALVICGDRDTLAYPAAGRFLSERLPHGGFALIPGAAHVPFLSHADAFGAALDGFLDG